MLAKVTKNKDGAKQSLCSIEALSKRLQKQCNAEHTTKRVDSAEDMFDTSQLLDYVNDKNRLKDIEETLENVRE